MSEDVCRPIDLGGVRIRVLAARGCPYFEAGASFAISDIVPGNMCPDLFFTMYPYAIGLAGNAWYNWTDDKRSVSAQCPAPSGKVAARVTRLAQQREQTKLRVEVLDSRPMQCGYRHRQGQTQDFAMKSATCFHAFGVLYPYVRFLVASDREDATGHVRCPDPTHGCVFELSRFREGSS